MYKKMFLTWNNKLLQIHLLIPWAPCHCSLKSAGDMLLVILIWKKKTKKYLIGIYFFLGELRKNRKNREIITFFRFENFFFQRKKTLQRAMKMI